MSLDDALYSRGTQRLRRNRLARRCVVDATERAGMARGGRLGVGGDDIVGGVSAREEAEWVSRAR